MGELDVETLYLPHDEPDPEQEYVVACQHCDGPCDTWASQVCTPCRMREAGNLPRAVYDAHGGYTITTADMRARP